MLLENNSYIDLWPLYYLFKLFMFALLTNVSYFIINNNQRPTLQKKKTNSVCATDPKS